MASHERKVSEIFHENPRLVRKIPVLIRQLFRESESEFKRRLRNSSEEKQQNDLTKLYDILFMDFFFDELDDWFMSYVIDHHVDRFTDEELTEMRAQASSHFDFYEVIEVYPGEGSRIQSLYTEKEYFLRDISSSNILSKWDIILMRRYNLGDISYATGSLSLFQPLDRQRILGEIKKAHEQYIDLFDDEEYSRFAKNRWDIFIQIESDLYESYKNKAFYTNYGKLQLCEVRFQVNDLQTILQRMKDQEEFNFIEKKISKDKKKKRQMLRYQWEWLTCGIEEEISKIRIDQPENGVIFSTHQLDGSGKQIGIEQLGQIFLNKYLFRLETRSVELAEFAVNRFTSLFEESLIFKRIIRKDIKKLRKNRESASEPVAPKQPDAQSVRIIMEEVYMSILDKKIPALNNMTPREARRDMRMLPLLITWLKSFENMEEKKRRQGEPYFSVEKLKKELNINY